MKDGEKDMETIIIGMVAGAVAASIMPQCIMPKLF
jgi:uncharacterized membrane protein YeaQ/YmgE (transglycosylase-associated protein family)